MDKIVEEIITNLIKRVEALEQKQTKPEPIQNGIPLASPAQTGLIQSLGGNPWPGITKNDATQLIQKLLEIKNKPVVSHPESPRVTEPKEVNTDDAGLDEEGLL